MTPVLDPVFDDGAAKVNATSLRVRVATVLDWRILDRNWRQRPGDDQQLGLGKPIFTSQAPGKKIPASRAG